MVFGDVAEQGEFLLGGILQRLLGATDEEIGSDPRAAQFLHGVLGRLGLLLAHDPQHGNQADVHEADVLAADAELELAQCLDEGCALDVAHGSAEFDDAHVRLLSVAVHGYLRHPLDPLLDLVGDVRDHLHCLAEVVAAPFPLDDVGVHLAGGEVVVTCERDVEEALVVAQVEVDLAAIVEHEHLAVLER